MTLVPNIGVQLTDRFTFRFILRFILRFTLVSKGSTHTLLPPRFACKF